MKKKRTLLILLLLMGLFMGKLNAQRFMENLNRGVIAMNRGDGSVYVSWRLLATDDNNIGFNLYRSEGGGSAQKLNSSVITSTTDYVDNSVNLAQSNAYYVKTVVNGVEEETGETYTLAANAPVRQYVPVQLASISDGTYRVEHVYVGDIDGDGDYDYIVKRFLISDTQKGTIKLDCYTNDGTFKWRIDLGPNIETTNSSMTSPVLVYDFNGDGKAEVLAKTGESTTFGNGATIGDTNGDGITDYNTYVYDDYAHVFEGPEFLSMINGETGAEMARTDFITRGNVCDWGDCYGARVNFIMASVAYLDGVHPSAVFSRGPGGHMVVQAYDFTNGSFSNRWSWTSVGKTFATGTQWVDFHQIKCVDVDNDGKDEISWGACMLDDNGTVLYTTELVHGDRFQIGDLNPNRSGLEVYAIQQNNPTLLGAALYDAATGSMIKKWYSESLQDVGRGDAGDVDPNVLGMEIWSLTNPNLQSCTGDDISSTRPYPDLSVWWDGDLQREFFVGIGSGGYNPAINKWNSSTGSTNRIFTIYNDGGSYVVTSPYAGRAPFIGDIFGDWREEIALETSDHSQLRIYTTKIQATARIYTLMQNPAYRIDVTTKGYLCSKLPDYYLGTGMGTPPAPNIVIAGGTGNISLSATASNGQVDLSWSSQNITAGQEIMRDTDSNPAGRGKIATVAASVRSYTDTDVTNGTTYYYWIKATDVSGNVINSNAAEATPSCAQTAITPYVQIDGGSWSQSSTATVSAGGTVKFGPQASTGGSWSWGGPNGFSASTREATISNIQTNQAGDYVATYTNSSGCNSNQTFVVTVNGGPTGSSITVRAKGSVGGEQIQLLAGGSTLATWTLTTGYQDYTATGSGTVSVYFINDNGSLDVQTDYITIDGTAYQAEDQATNTGVWSGTCGGSYSEWLHCNGYIQFDTPEGTSSPVTLTIQEDETGFCSVDGTVDSNNSGYTGVGFANTNNASGNGVTWSVNIPASGSYELVWQYANGGSTDRTGQLMVDGATVVSTINMPSTGSWTSWTSTSTTTVSLSAGTRVIRLQATNSAGLSNVDYMGITGTNPTGVSCMGTSSAESSFISNSIDLKVFPNPLKGGIINVAGNLEANSEVHIIVYDEMGQVIGRKDPGIIEKGSFTESMAIDVQAGMYFVKMITDQGVRTIPFIKE